MQQLKNETTNNSTIPDTANNYPVNNQPGSYAKYNDIHKINEVEILLIEDNITDATIIINALATINFADKIIHVKDGEIALDFIFGKGEFYNKGKRKIPKLILLNINIAKVNGTEVLRHIKGNEITKVIPVVVLASYKDDIEATLSYNLGANSFIKKPIDNNRFTKLISDLALYWLLVNHPPYVVD
jgi:two-component system response regulator